MISPQFGAYADALRPVAHHHPCERCGYSLFTLVPGSRCPECGLEVWKSLRQDTLDDCDPRWRITIAWGARMIAAALAPAIVLVCPGLDDDTIRGCVALALPMLGVGLAIGVCFFSRIDRTRGRQRPGPFLGWIMRGLSLCVLAACAGLGYAEGHPGRIRHLFAVALSGALPTLLVFVLAYAGQLSARLPHRSLTRCAGVLKWWAMVLSVAGPLLMFESVQLLPVRLMPGIWTTAGAALGIFQFITVCLLWKLADRCADVPLSALPDPDLRRARA